MEYRILPKDNLNEFVKRLGKAGQVYGPVQQGEDDFSFEPVSSADEIAWHYINTAIPAKKLLLPQTEPLFQFSTSGPAELKPIYDTEKRILFGVRSCDVSAIAYLDKVFADDYPDIYYLSRRQNLTIISLTCQRPGNSCFCICADCGPFLERGFDVQMTDLGDKFLLEVATEKGKELMAGMNDLLSDSSSLDVERRNELARATEDKFLDTTTYFSQAVRKITTEKVPKDIWVELGDKCLACGGCSYVCPTCSCFNVVDHIEDGVGIRSRRWDSCALAGFTRMAGGHNPRREKQDRRNRRFYHKLSYYYVEIMGRHGCVGCGRCIDVCLGDIGMSKVVHMIKKPAAEAAEAEQAAK